MIKLKFIQKTMIFIRNIVFKFILICAQLLLTILMVIVIYLGIFFLSQALMSKNIYSNIQQNIADGKREMVLRDLLDKNQNVERLCIAPVYKKLSLIKEKYHINHLSSLKLEFIDRFDFGENHWKILALNKQNVTVDSIPHQFSLKQKDFFCVNPDAKLIYLDRKDEIFYLEIKE